MWFLGPRSGNLTSFRFRSRFLISMSLNFLIYFHCFYFFDQFPCMKPVAISFSRGSSQPRDWTRVSCITRWIHYHWATWEAYFLPYFSHFLICLFWLKYNLNTVKQADLKCSTQWNFPFVNTYVITQIRYLSTSAKHPSCPFSDTPTPRLPLLYTSTID